MVQRAVPPELAFVDSAATAMRLLATITSKAMLSDCIKIHTFAVWEFFDRVKVHRLRHVNDQQSPDLGDGIKLETVAKPLAALTHILDAANMPQHSVRLFPA